VAGVTPIAAGRTYAEVRGSVNTGVAFANPSSLPVTITFFFTDQFGTEFGQSTLTLGGNAQTARFLNEAPFNIRIDFVGAFTFTATAPVAVVALRTLTNERSEFLIAAQTVVSLIGSTPGDVLLPHFAEGAGWKTQVLLINTTDSVITGTLQFFNQGSVTSPAAPLTLTLNGQLAASFGYSIRARSSQSFETAGLASVIQVGSVRITPATGTAPAAFGVLSYSTGGFTTSMASVPVQAPSIAFRSFVEATAATGAAGSIQTGVAITNNSAAASTVTFELTGLDGVLLGPAVNVTIPGFGHVSRFVNELFPSALAPLGGVLRISSGGSIAMTALRTRYNERGDFLITTMPVSNEASSSTSAELLFPHIAAGGGYTTQFVLFSGVTNQSTTGTLRFVGSQGQALNLIVR
jgi:hypothetical protein